MSGQNFMLIEGGRVVDPANGLDMTADLLLEGSVIRAVGRPAPPSGCQVLNADGLVVAPGLVDMHVHLREPGFEFKETIYGIGFIYIERDRYECKPGIYMYMRE